jgi:DNA-binding CsgD family transcriptional regulator
MSKTVEAIQYLTQMYREVWQPLSTDALMRYYDRKVIGQSGKLTIGFDDIYQHISSLKERYDYVQPNFHNIMAVDDRIVAWLTQAPINQKGQPDYLLNTMVNYQIKRGKLIRVEFMWDKPVSFVMTNLADTEKAGIEGARTDIEERLTRRELECFFHVIQGKTAKQIARELQLSPRTIESYLDNMKIKLGLDSTSQVMEYAVSNGFVSVSPLLAQALRSHTPSTKA